MANKKLLDKRMRGNEFTPTNSALEENIDENEVEVVKEYRASLRVTNETRDRMNALRKITEFKNVDDLVNHLIDEKVETLTDKSRRKFEVMVEK